MNAFVMAAAVIAVMVGGAVLFATWVRFCGWLSDFEWWGYWLAMSPIFIGTYLLLAALFGGFA